MRSGHRTNDNIPAVVVRFSNQIVYIYGGHFVVSYSKFPKNVRQIFFSDLSDTFDSLHWNTSFPAVTVCETFNGEKNWDLSERFELIGSSRFLLENFLF